MKKISTVMLTSLVSLGLVGCSSISNQDIGAGTGAVLGGIAGSTVGKGHGKTAATIAGAVVGGALGGAVGKSMDDVDRLKMNQALEANRTNQTATWTNPDNSTTYALTPTRTFTGPGGEPCRDFTTNAKVNGQNQTLYGTACRDSSGKWRIVSS